MEQDKRLAATARLLEVMNTLRRKCPWDREQTFESLRSNTIEETYELADAITDGNMEGIKEELGDLLLHVVFYSKLGEEAGAFDFAEVADALCDKLIYRHPHIYGDVHANTPDEVKENWEALKLRKKNRKSGTLGGVPRSLPAMVKAYRMGEKPISKPNSATCSLRWSTPAGSTVSIPNRPWSARTRSLSAVSTAWRNGLRSAGTPCTNSRPSGWRSCGRKRKTKNKMAIIRKIRGREPSVGENTFLAETAVLLGDVTVGRDCSIWYNAVLRGDVNKIVIGDRTNIQDGAVLHTIYDGAKHPSQTIIGNDVSVGHNAVVHGARIGDNCLIGMGSILLDNAVIPSGCIIAAGALVLSNAQLEPDSVYAGVPAKKVKDVTPEQRDEIIRRTAHDYMLYASWYKEE